MTDREVDNRVLRLSKAPVRVAPFISLMPSAKVPSRLARLTRCCSTVWKKRYRHACLSCNHTHSTPTKSRFQSMHVGPNLVD
jgi:hypothetical protein